MLRWGRVREALPNPENNQVFSFGHIQVWRLSRLLGLPDGSFQKRSGWTINVKVISGQMTFRAVDWVKASRSEYRWRRALLALGHLRA